MRLFAWLALLPIGFVASAACQMLSGVDELEVVPDRDASGGAAGLRNDGSTGSGGAVGTGGDPATGGAPGSGGTWGSGATVGTGGSAGDGGTSGSAGSAGSDDGGGGVGGSAAVSGTGGAAQCVAPTDCPAESDECASRTCTSGSCGLRPEPQATVVTQQTAGDCKKNVCDGSGQIVSVNDDTDLKDDGNVCTRNVCTNGAPSHPPEPLNTPCGANTKCDGAGRCVGCTSNNDCPADTPCTDWSCVTTSGTCASAPRSTTTTCGPAPACTSGVEYLQDYCDGAGACRDSGSKPCSPRVCGTGACVASCTTDTHCVAGYYCAAGGACQAKKALGATCAQSVECTTGFCVDGVCCGTACTGLCNTCNGADSSGTPGSCAPIAAGRDPANECTGGRACNGSNGCTGVQNCDCGTLRYSPYENCCTSCSGSTDCPSQVYPCNNAHNTPCYTIGETGNYRAGQGIVDQSGQCPDTGTFARRCAVFVCTCVQ